MADDLLAIDINSVMNKDVVRVTEERPINEIAEILKSRNIGCVVVTDSQGIMGILTERDIIHKVVAPNLDPAKLSVKDIMTGNVITISPYDTIELAVDLMREKKIKKLPVADGDKLVGIVTMTDLLGILRSIEKGMLKRFMERKKG